MRLRAHLLEVLAIVYPRLSRGDTTIQYTVRRAGKVSLRGPGIRPRKNRFDQPKSWGFTVVPTTAKEELRGHPKVRVRIAFDPVRGREEARELTLSLWQTADVGPRHPPPAPRPAR